MTISELHHELLQAYSLKNLNNISLTLINLFKTRQFTVLQKIADIISDFVSITIKDDGKGFSGFMMLYHPDRAEYHIKEINSLTLQNNFDGLLEYSHILKLERIEEIAASLNSYEDIDYAPVYAWNLETEGFTIVDDRRAAAPVKTTTKLVGYTFYDAIKLREYGNTDTEFPSYYLENIDEFELAFSDIIDLDGIQYCIHAKSFDLSDNRITDLSPLMGLTNIEELNLSDNQLSYIDAISNLLNLKSVDLSDNLICDISPLFELEHLEYADLTGNPVENAQISRLTDAGVIVDK